MKNLIFKIAVLTGTVAAFASCSDTWLMYDTSQKDKLYFKYENYPSLDQYLSTDFSFALLDESVKEVKKTVTVTLLGMPADRDRTFEVRAIHDTTSNYTTGGVQRGADRRPSRTKTTRSTGSSSRPAPWKGRST